MHRESGGQTRKLSWTTTYGEDIANVCSVPGVSTTGVCKDPSKQPKDKIRRSRLFTLRFHRNVCGSLKIFRETGILFRVHFFLGFFFIKSVNERFTQRFYGAGCAIESSWKNFFIREEKRVVDWYRSRANRAIVPRMYLALA